MAIQNPDILRFMLKVERMQAQLTRKTAVKLYNILTGPPPEGTPVKYGVARAGWHLGVNRVITDVPDRPPARSRGRQSVIRRHAPEDAHERLHPGDEINITNAVPYVPLLNQGWSAQSPAGFIDDAVDYVIATYGRSVAEVQNEEG